MTEKQNLNYRKKLIFRASHRGVREMDILIGSYVKAKIYDMSDEEIDMLEYLMSFADRDLMAWFLGEVQAPQHVQNKIYQDIKHFHKIS